MVSWPLSITLACPFHHLGLSKHGDIQGIVTIAGRAALACSKQLRLSLQRRVDLQCPRGAFAVGEKVQPRVAVEVKPRAVDRVQLIGKRLGQGIQPADVLRYVLVAHLHQPGNAPSHDGR